MKEIGIAEVTGFIICKEWGKRPDSGFSKEKILTLWL
jgi:hypothetical protein